jgi:hypothetical protein
VWIITAQQLISLEVTGKVLRSAVYPKEWTGLMMICCGMAVKRMGMLRVNVRKMKALSEDGDSDTDW